MYHRKSENVPCFELVAAARAQGGFTYDCRTGTMLGKGVGCKPISGWAVGIPGYTHKASMKTKDSVIIDHVAWFVDHNASRLFDENEVRFLLGGWVQVMGDGAEWLVLDLVVVVDDKDMAMRYGREYGQLEVFCFDDETSYPVS